MNVTCEQLRAIIKHRGHAERYRKLEEKLCGENRAPAKPPPKPLGTTGTKLKELLAEAGITEFKGCACKNRAAKMDRLGVAWCEEHRDEIAAWLAEAASKAGWLTKGIAAAKLLTKSYFRVGDPYGSLVEEAIRRSKES